MDNQDTIKPKFKTGQVIQLQLADTIRLGKIVDVSPSKQFYRIEWMALPGQGVEAIGKRRPTADTMTVKSIDFHARLASDMVNVLYGDDGYE